MEAVLTSGQHHQQRHPEPLSSGGNSLSRRVDWPVVRDPRAAETGWENLGSRSTDEPEGHGAEWESRPRGATCQASPSLKNSKNTQWQGDGGLWGTGWARQW